MFKEKVSKMNKGNLRKQMLRSTLASSISLMSMALGVAGLSMMIPASAVAQDYTTGALAGTVADQSGQPIAGASVTIRSTEQGYVRLT